MGGPRHSSDDAASAEAARLTGTLDRLYFYLRKWFLQESYPGGVAGAGVLGRYTLECLATSDGPMRMSDLAAALDTSSRNVTTIVDSLEAQGLVRRRPHPNDRRALVIELVGTVKEARLPLREHHRGGAAFFADVSKDDRDTFIRVAEHLIAAARTASRTEPSDPASGAE